MANPDDLRFMRLALELGQQAARSGEVPIGAVLVREGEVIGQGFNAPISRHDPTAHAEIQALREAAERIGNYRLPGATLYVTLEPCVMCVGALVHARVSRLVFGAREPKAGAVVSQAQLLDSHPFNWRIETEEGLLAEDCRELMSSFFAQRRAARREQQASEVPDDGAQPGKS